jgi:hypothetical protein
VVAQHHGDGSLALVLAQPQMVRGRVAAMCFLASFSHVEEDDGELVGYDAGGSQGVTALAGVEA